MLDARVYRRLMQLARLARPRVVVEIGTAHGAATIALALGARAGGEPFHVYTVDPFSGFSSRVQYGTVEDNLRVVREACDGFGVTDCITFVVGTVDDLVARLPPGTIDVVMIDADGRIDRDLAAIYDRLAEHAHVVIDDVDGTLCLTRFANRIYCDQKHRLTRLIVDQLLASGHLQGEHVEVATGFYAKGTGAAAAIEPLATPAYRQLVFADIDAIALPRRPSAFRRGWARLGRHVERVRRCFDLSVRRGPPGRAFDDQP